MADAELLFLEEEENNVISLPYLSKRRRWRKEAMECLPFTFIAVPPCGGVTYVFVQADSLPQPPHKGGLP